MNMPCNLQVVGVVHLLTGVLLISGALSTERDLGIVYGVMLLLFSCCVVLMLCRCSSGNAASLDLDAKSARLDLEAPSGTAAFPNGGVTCSHFEAAGAPPADDTDRAVTAEAGGEQVEQAAADAGGAAAAAGAAAVAAPSWPSKAAEAELPSERYPAEHAPRDMQISVREPRAIVTEDSSMLDGLRCMLAYHLRCADVVSLTEAQAELLEHHLMRLAAYSQKIVHTMAFAQRVFGAKDEDSNGQDGQEAGSVDSQKATEETSMETARKKPKKLRLDDDELLRIFSLAQHEAELEADWRGINFPASRDRVPPLVLTPTPGVHCGAAPAVTLQSTPSQQVPSGRSQKEREEAIGLLGQALGARRAGMNSSRDLAAASEDLALRLIPVRPPRPCDNVVERAGYATTCCLMELSEDPSSAGHVPPRGPGRLDDGSAAHLQFLVPPEREEHFESSCRQSRSLNANGDAVLNVTPSEVRRWLSAEAGNKAVHPGIEVQGTPMVQSMPVLSDGANSLTMRGTAEYEAVRPGSILLCRERVDVFESASAWTSIGHIEAGRFIQAAGPVERSRGHMMVPILPRGAVQVQAFDIHEAPEGQALHRQTPMWPATPRGANS